MSIIIDTPDGIAFARAASRAGALHMELRGMKRSGRRTIYSIVKEVYGFAGNREQVSQQLDDFVEGTLAIRQWAPEYAKAVQGIAQEALRRAEEEGAGMRLQQVAESNVQAFFESFGITEQEGNDACLLIFVEVVRQHAGSR